MLAVHGCGGATDLCMRVAMALGGGFASMPCCYGAPPEGLPPALAEVCGRGFAQDIHRTYALERDGYRVAWSAIPHAITTKNRILIATRA